MSRAECSAIGKILASITSLCWEIQWREERGAWPTTESKRAAGRELVQQCLALELAATRYMGLDIDPPGAKPGQKQPDGNIVPLSRWRNHP